MQPELTCRKTGQQIQQFIEKSAVCWHNNLECEDYEKTISDGASKVDRICLYYVRFAELSIVS